MTARGERAARQSSTPDAATSTRRTSRPKTTPRARTRLRLDTGDDVDVSSSVTIVAAGDEDSNGGHDDSHVRRDDGASGGRAGDRDDEDDEKREDNQSGRSNPPRGQRAATMGNQYEQEDDFESMGWWSALTPGQQRSMMRRFLMQPPIAAAAQQPVVIQAPTTETPRRRRMKSLKLDDFRGLAGESVKAWLATIPQEVERQASLGGDTWSAKELFYGATAHLKDAAGKWLITLREAMGPDDRNLNYLITAMRKKYGRRDTMFDIQQRLAARVQQPGERLSDYASSLTNIGFRKRVPAESYVQAFINRINSVTTSTQVRTYEPQTLDETVRFAEDKCGEFGEGFKVTDWRVAKRRYRKDRRIDEEGEVKPTKRKASTEASPGPIDWKKLGLGFGGSDDPPSFDMDGKPVDGLAKTAKRDPVSLAALQAMIYFAELRKDAKLAPASTLKTSRVLEVKAENNQDETEPERYQERKARGNGWANRGGGRNGGRGSGPGRGGGSSGRGPGLENYGPNVDRPSIMERKKQSTCTFCGKLGHRWLECQARIANDAAIAQLQANISNDPGVSRPAVTASASVGNQEGQ